LAQFKLACDTLGVVDTFVDECPTRWIYLDRVLERYLKLKPVLLQVRDEGMFADRDIQAFVSIPNFHSLSFMHKSLSLVHQFCEFLQIQKGVIITDVPTRLSKLQDELRELPNSPDIDTLAVQFTSAVSHALQDRCHFVLATVNPILLAARLDPLHCQLPMVESTMHRLLDDRLIALMCHIDSDMTIDLAAQLYERVRVKLRDFSAACFTEKWDFETRNSKFWAMHTNSTPCRVFCFSH
jgi:hypothetical protein